jgi:hypothetical protein
MPATGGARRRHSTMHLDCSLPECPSSLAAGHRTAGQGRGVVKIQTAGNDITPEAPGLSLGHGPAAWRRLPRRDNGAVAHDGTVAPVAAVWCFRNFVVLRWSASHLRCGRRSSRPPWPQCRPTRPPRRICSALGCGWPGIERRRRNAYVGRLPLHSYGSRLALRRRSEPDEFRPAAAGRPRFRPAPRSLGD